MYLVCSFLTRVKCYTPDYVVCWCPTFVFFKSDASVALAIRTRTPHAPKTTSTAHPRRDKANKARLVPLHPT